jgi:hypothetical protein
MKTTTSSNSLENLAYRRGEHQRSMNGDLEQGMIDGSHKQVVKDRGGDVDPATYEARKTLNDTWYGIHECPDPHTPDGLHTHSRYYVATPKPDPESF